MAFDPPYHRIQVYQESNDATSIYYLATLNDSALAITDLVEVVRNAINEATGQTDTTVDSYEVVDTLVPPPA